MDIVGEQRGRVVVVEQVGALIGVGEDNTNRRVD